MDNAPAHPPNLLDLLSRDFSFIKVKFLPPNTTPLLQPMDQQVISNFKKLYTKAVFEKCFEVTTDTQLMLREFWRNHFSIYSSISLIGKAWEGVTSRTLNSTWRQLWPDCVQKRDFEWFETDPHPDPADPLPAVDSIVVLGKSLGLEVSGEDVEELVEDHREELTTEELQELHLEQYQTTAENLASEEEEEEVDEVPSSKIKEICAKWNVVQMFVEKYHPEQAETSHLCNKFSDKTMSHFREMLKRHQKQRTVDSYFVRQMSSDSQAGPSGIKRQRREVTPKRTFSEVLMEGDFPSKH
ncbi:tigger transposable element-derived protein 1-like [Cherax quadricarinatus]|uniref:tigger transposable element-derived protein 1-like n=1 Tax=Cherax quadricarinatus TaxID=27406 RepID=UPI00387EBEB4